jgi:hypothetical protein
MILLLRLKAKSLVFLLLVLGGFEIRGAGWPDTDWIRVDTGLE